MPCSDPDSTTYADNLVGTCRQCHEGVDERFAASYTHTALSITANPINRWIRGIYWVLIAVVIGGMVVHNLVILNFHAEAEGVRPLDVVRRLVEVVRS